jgi:FkbM family methyltransferase
LANVFDIGGRAGIHRSWCNFGLPVNYYCFEPDADEVKRLQIRNENNLNIIQAAIGGQTGVAKLYLYDKRDLSSLFQLDQSSTYRYKDAVLEKTIDVDVMTLDDVVAKFGIFPQFMSVDAQGASYQILRGGLKNLENTLGIRCEVEFFGLYHKAPLFNQVFELLVEKNFSLIRLESCGPGKFGISSEMNNYSVSPNDARPAAADAIFINKTRVKEMMAEQYNLQEALDVAYFIAFCIHNGCGYFGLEVLDQIKTLGGTKSLFQELPKDVFNELTLQCYAYLSIDRENINVHFNGEYEYKKLFGASYCEDLEKKDVITKIKKIYQS